MYQYIFFFNMVKLIIIQLLNNSEDIPMWNTEVFNDNIGYIHISPLNELSSKKQMEVDASNLSVIIIGIAILFIIHQLLVIIRCAINIQCALIVHRMTLRCPEYSSSQHVILLMEESFLSSLQNVFHQERVRVLSRINKSILFCFFLSKSHNLLYVFNFDVFLIGLLYFQPLSLYFLQMSRGCLPSSLPSAHI